MTALNRNEKVKCEKCGAKYRRSDAARHRKRCEEKDESKCPNYNFMSKKNEEMDCHVGRKHAQPNSKQSTVCPSCEQEFRRYYSLQQHRRKEHETKQRKRSDTVAHMNKIVEEEDKMVKNLRRNLVVFNIFLWIRRWEMGDIGYLTSNCPN